MAKVTLSDLSNLQNEQSVTATLNANNDAIEVAMEKTLSRDGTSPNTMSANIDMNSNRILNLPAPISAGEPLIYGDEVPIPDIFVQNDAPSTDEVEGSIWVDANSSDNDLYQLVSSVWTDTGVNLKGSTGAGGSNGTDGDDGSLIFIQNSAPSTSVPSGSMWVDADSTDNDLYQISAGSWVDTGVNLRGAAGAGTGDVVGPASSVDAEIVLFDSTTGQLIKRASGSGLVAASSGVFTGPRTITAPAAGITVSNGNGVSGNPTLALADDLSAVEGLSSNGVAVRSGTSTWTVRTITGTSNVITITNGDGVSGNPTITVGSLVARTDTANTFTAVQGYGESALTYTSGGTTAWDVSAAPAATVTCASGNTTMGAPSNVTAGRIYKIRIVQDSTPRTIAWNAAYKFIGAAAPTISTGSGAVDHIVFYGRASNVLEEIGRAQAVA